MKQGKDNSTELKLILKAISSLEHFIEEKCDYEAEYDEQDELPLKKSVT